jgi:hypothetical protein
MILEMNTDDTLKIMAKTKEAECCLLLDNLSISNFSFLVCSFLILNNFFSLFSSSHLFFQLNDDVVVPIAGWCVSRVSFYMSVLVVCSCDERW